MPPPLLRSNPLYTEEEEQEVVIIVDSLDSTEGEGTPPTPRAPRRAPSTSSGYGSAGGSHGRVSPSVPKSDRPPGPAQPDPDLGLDGSHSQSTSDSDSPVCTLSRSLKEDIRSCLGGHRIIWDKDVGEVVHAATRGAGGVSAARARLHAALLALHEAPRLPNRGPSLPYCGPGVRPGDVTMMPKNTQMSLLATSALFTLDEHQGADLTRRLQRGEKRRQRCKVLLSILALALLLISVGAVELVLSKGQMLFGTVLR